MMPRVCTTINIMFTRLVVFCFVRHAALLFQLVVVPALRPPTSAASQQATTSPSFSGRAGEDADEHQSVFLQSDEELRGGRGTNVDLPAGQQASQQHGELHKSHFSTTSTSTSAVLTGAAATTHHLEEDHGARHSSFQHQTRLTKNSNSTIEAATSVKDRLKAGCHPRNLAPVLCGSLLALQAASNGRLAEESGNPLFASLCSSVVGGTVMLALGAMSAGSDCVVKKLLSVSGRNAEQEESSAQSEEKNSPEPDQDPEQQGVSNDGNVSLTAPPRSEDTCAAARSKNHRGNEHREEDPLADARGLGFGQQVVGVSEGNRPRWNSHNVGVASSSVPPVGSSCLKAAVVPSGLAEPEQVDVARSARPTTSTDSSPSSCPGPRDVLNALASVEEEQMQDALLLSINAACLDFMGQDEVVDEHSRTVRQQIAYEPIEEGAAGFEDQYNSNPESDLSTSGEATWSDSGAGSGSAGRGGHLFRTSSASGATRILTADKVARWNVAWAMARGEGDEEAEGGKQSNSGPRRVLRSAVDANAMDTDDQEEQSGSEANDQEDDRGKSKLVEIEENYVGKLPGLPGPRPSELPAACYSGATQVLDETSTRRLPDPEQQRLHSIFGDDDDHVLMGQHHHHDRSGVSPPSTSPNRASRATGCTTSSSSSSARPPARMFSTASPRITDWMRQKARGGLNKEADGEGRFRATTSYDKKSNFSFSLHPRRKPAIDDPFGDDAGGGDTSASDFEGTTEMILNLDDDSPSRSDFNNVAPVVLGKRTSPRLSHESNTHVLKGVALRKADGGTDGKTQQIIGQHKKRHGGQRDVVADGFALASVHQQLQQQGDFASTSNKEQETTTTPSKSANRRRPFNFFPPTSSSSARQAAQQFLDLFRAKSTKQLQAARKLFYELKHTKNKRKKLWFLRRFLSRLVLGGPVAASAVALACMAVPKTGVLSYTMAWIVGQMFVSAAVDHRGSMGIKRKMTGKKCLASLLAPVGLLVAAAGQTGTRSPAGETDQSQLEALVKVLIPSNDKALYLLAAMLSGGLMPVARVSLVQLNALLPNRMLTTGGIAYVSGALAQFLFLVILSKPLGLTTASELFDGLFDGNDDPSSDFGFASTAGTTSATNFTTSTIAPTAAAQLAVEASSFSSSKSLEALLVRLPLITWCGGFVGAVQFFSILLFQKKIGALRYFLLVLLGQLSTSLPLDHYGLLGFERREVTAYPVAGVVLVLLSVLFNQAL
ncbi:unnamed protein product [Amoebophrya sp. A120]|nr:unnamed protein product [Amoebophrya sp. A120]|eukprot:GSA120T00023622001.1